jgi:small subunit ribosomal protein S17
MNREKEQVIKRRLKGVVVSDKMAKTAVVSVTHDRRHPKYLKYYKITKRFKAHDENKEYKVGDKVIIEETRPISKDKRWRVVGKI